MKQFAIQVLGCSTCPWFYESAAGSPCCHGLEKPQQLTIGVNDYQRGLPDANCPLPDVGPVEWTIVGMYMDNLQPFCTHGPGATWEEALAAYFEPEGGVPGSLNVVSVFAGRYEDLMNGAQEIAG